jgi:hypothetical protein
VDLPHERLFEFRVEPYGRWVCELRTHHDEHGDVRGIEAVLLKDDDFHRSCTFPALGHRPPRDLAIAWAEHERNRICRELGKYAIDQPRPVKQ